MNTTITITKAVYGGYGLGFLDGKAVFVPSALPGETIKIEITQDKKDHAFARPIQIIEASPERVTPGCENFGRCGGCDYLHIPYESELAIKKDIALETMRRIARLDPEKIPEISMHYSERFGSRSHATFRFNDKGLPGFYERGTNTPAPFPREGCPLLSPELRRTLSGMKGRESDGNIKIAAGYDGVARFSTEKKCVIRERDYGFSYDRDISCFYQANRFLRSSMIEKVLEFAAPMKDETFADIACGAGFFTLPLADMAAQGTGYDIAPLTIQWARHNATMNGIENVSFHAEDSGVFHIEDKKPDLIVVDPPRTGLTRKTVERLSSIAPDRIVYVSCNPSTFARDLQNLMKTGYSLHRLHLEDMFPGTFHIELIALLCHS
ncbi:MAG TPA: class I SAM-dependent RNA methyltransferase [Spirochaetota bacterium]|nr:class I SAM-dependent RNA methyltransferase [Spirochaetota bacterium]